ncbi:hypothetical protein SDC9_139030 [bioreactor metagenome]|uniref:Uncharacterized protein n=1 Tax=bioreactor metagenome TaxID=1076179 RepID=A0A645DRF6_9ZZZZ
MLFSISRESDGIIIITSDGTKKIITDKSALEVIAEKGSALKYNIKVSNNTKDSFAIYCYKYKDSSALFNIKNEKGKVLYYNNLVKQDSGESNKEVTRLYDINIKVSKGDSNYEIKFNKAMVK